MDQEKRPDSEMPGVQKRENEFGEWLKRTWRVTGMLNVFYGQDDKAIYNTSSYF